MTRRPGSDPDLLVSSVDRDTWQGMANARVPSAFPIDRYRIPDPQRRPLVVPSSLAPTNGIIHAESFYAAFGSTFPAFPEGMTSAVALVGACASSGLVVPDGWTVLESGGPYGVGSIINEWAVLSIDNPTGAEQRDWTFADIAAGPYRGVASVVAYFTGGTPGGGSWSALVGPKCSNLSDAYPTEVPDGAKAWVQFGITTAVYNLGGYGAPANCDRDQGLAAHFFCSPMRGPFTVMPHDPMPPGDLIDWEGIGAYGLPNSVSFAAVWA